MTYLQKAWFRKYRHKLVNSWPERVKARSFLLMCILMSAQWKKKREGEKAKTSFIASDGKTSEIYLEWKTGTRLGSSRFHTPLWSEQRDLRNLMTWLVCVRNDLWHICLFHHRPLPTLCASGSSCWLFLMMGRRKSFVMENCTDGVTSTLRWEGVSLWE